MNDMIDTETQDCWLRDAGLAHQRQMGTARLAKTQLLSEWRVANEMLKQMTKAGLKVSHESLLSVFKPMGLFTLTLMDWLGLAAYHA